MTSGSRGDVQPYFGLGWGLKKAVYEVRLIASEDFEALIRRSGLEFSSMGPNIQALIESDEWWQTLESGNFLAILGKFDLR